MRRPLARLPRVRLGGAPPRLVLPPDAQLEAVLQGCLLYTSLLVVGGGSGGLACAQRAADYGARVALIESGRLGGTCVNVGCVPKKIMWNASEIQEAVEDGVDYGFLPTPAGHDWPSLKAKRDAYVLRLNGMYARSLASRKIEHIEGLSLIHI